MRYVHLPTIVEAVQWDGKNAAEISAFVGRAFNGYNTLTHELYLLVDGTEAPVVPGFFIIKGERGDVYPCSPDIFEARYVAA